MTETEKYLDSVIRKVPDFPKPGILFYDITSIMTHPDAFKFCIDKLEERYKDAKIDAIAAIESRGFIFASPLAERLGLPLVLIRKKGKLPGDVYQASYDLEYGSATIEVHKADVNEGQKFLVIDDLIATGGTFGAAKKLLQQAKAEVVEFAGIISLPDLNFEKALAPTPVFRLIDYHGA
ncbi:MAG: adenine phosphoribosyltransferase [Treponemataceae bacterium]|nr:adenine phosphoribosyltransferase [Treponemataceae bacterium]